MLKKIEIVNLYFKICIACYTFFIFLPSDGVTFLLILPLNFDTFQKLSLQDL